MANTHDAEYIQHTEEVDNWVNLALVSYCLRNPGFADSPGIDSQGFAPFLRWGQELDILEYDLAQCGSEFILSSRSFYREASELNVRKFVILYHVDNFNVRLSKLVDNIHGLVGLTEKGADLTVYQTLGEVRRRLDEFKLAALVRSALRDRNRFVHEYRELPLGKGWDLFAPKVRLESIEDPDAELIRYEMDSGPIDAFVYRKIGELRELLDMVRTLRCSCFESLAVAVVGRAFGLASRKDHPILRYLRSILELYKGHESMVNLGDGIGS